MKKNNIELVEIYRTFRQALEESGVVVDDNLISTMKIMKIFVSNFIEKGFENLLPDFFDISIDYMASDIKSDFVEVITNTELTKTQKKAVESKIKAKFGDKVKIIYSIDEKIYGGLLIKHGDKVLDLSLNKKLDDMKRALIN